MHLRHNYTEIFIIIIKEVKAFSKLEGNVHVTVHLVNEGAGGCVLLPDAMTVAGYRTSISVHDAFFLKHQESCVLPATTLPGCDSLS